MPLRTSVSSIELVDALRSTTLGTVVSKAAIFLGIAMLLQSWLVLGHDVMHGRLISTTRLRWTLAIWCAPLVFAPPLFSRDVYSYYAQGQLMNAGGDPYATGIASVPGWFLDGADPMWAESPAPYGQFFLLIERLVAAMTQGHPYWAAVVFRVIALVGVAALAWAVPKGAELLGVSRAKALWLGVLNPLVIMHFVSGVHNDAIMAALIAAGLVLTMQLRNRPGERGTDEVDDSARGLLRGWQGALIGTILIVLGASVKPIALVALPFVGIIWAGAKADFRRRVICWIAVGIVAVALLVLLAVISGTGFGWVSALSTPGKVRTWLSPPTALGMTIGGAFDLLGFGPSVDQVLNVVRLAALATGLGCVAWLALKPQGRSGVRGAALALFALVFFGPVLQPWYLLWSLPLFAMSGLSRLEFRAAMIVTTALTLLGLANSSATSDTLFKLSDGLSILFVAGIIIALIVTSPRERRFLLGEPDDPGLMPTDDAQRARYDEALVKS